MDRWMPLFAATVGVLGAIAGAVVGGSVANSGQQQGFERERAAAIQDLRRETYGEYLGTAQEVVANELAGFSKKVNKVFVRVFVAEARVALVAEHPEVERAAEQLRMALEYDDDKSAEQQLKEYGDAADRFRAVARQEIAESAE